MKRLKPCIINQLEEKGPAMHIHVQVETGVSDSLCLVGIMSATGNGYVIYMTIKRKTKLRPPELMTANLAIFDFGISGM